VTRLYYIISIHIHSLVFSSILFFFNDTATTEIYTLSLHDALPISRRNAAGIVSDCLDFFLTGVSAQLREERTSTVSGLHEAALRSEEHTSELQSLAYLVCRLLLEKKKK